MTRRTKEGITMKKYLLSLLFFIALPLICQSQVIVDSGKWGKLIDYVNSKYALAYCEKIDTNAYNRIKPSIKDNIDEAKSEKQLKSILKRNGCGDIYKKVVKPLHYKYNAKRAERTLDYALDLSELGQNIPGRLEAAQSVLREQIGQIFAQPASEKGSRYKSGIFGVYALLVFEMALIVVFCVIMLRQTSAERIHSIIDDKLMRATAKSDNKSEIQKLNKRIDSLESKVKELTSLISDTRNASSIESRKPEVKTQPSRPRPTCVYVKNFKEGLLRVVEESEAQYKLELINESKAQFSFCGDVERALHNFDGTFDHVCEWKGSISDAKEIENEKPGTAEKEPDGSKWKVTGKAKIIIR